MLTLEAAQAHGVERVLLFSSGGAVYGIPERLPIPEDHPLRPISAYGICKVAMENYLAMFAKRHGMRALIVRPSNPYGPGQDGRRQQGVIAVFTSKICQGEPVEIWGDGSATKDYLHVQDLAQATRLLLEADADGTFNIGSGVGTSVLEIVQAIEQKTGKMAQLNFRPAIPTDVPNFVLDIAKLREATQFRPRATLELA